MDEQKRLILAVVLSMLVIFGYQTYLVKTAPPEEEQVAASDTQTEKPSEQIVTTTPAADTGTKQLTPVGTTAAVPQRTDFKTIQVSTPYYTVAISEKGAVVKSYELKQYNSTNEEDSSLKQLVPEALKTGIFSLELEGGSIVGLADAVYTADAVTDEVEISQGQETIVFSWSTPQGYVVKKIFTFKADSYVVNFDISIENNTTGTLNDSIVIAIPGLYTKEVESRSRFAFEGPLLFSNNEYSAVRPKDIKIKEKDDADDIKEKQALSTFSGQIDWAGFSERYFMTAVMPQPNEEGVPAEGEVKLSFVDELVTTRFIQKMEPMAPGTPGTYSFAFYMGPKSQVVLDDYGYNLKECVNFGGWFNILDILAKPLLLIMNFIYTMVPNYGMAIILLTVLIKIVFWPLGTKSYKSMNQMKKLTPLMTEIREKYGDDKQRMNKEIMGLYKTYKVNPASGCLPMLVQMPIFFALYRMLYQAIELRHSSFVGWITDLSAPDRLFHFGFEVPFMENPDGIPMLTLIMGASFFLQQKMAPTTGDPAQAKMMMMMPIIMTVIFINFPAGLVLYMIINQIISIGQQYYIQKKFM